MFLIISTLFLGYVVYFYIREFIDRRKSPPGPWPLPIIGNILNLAMASNVSSLAIAKVGEEYGEIYRIKMGSTDLVVPTSIEAIQTTFSNDDVSGRDIRGTLSDRNFGKKTGIVLGEGPTQEKLKAWTIRNLREFGFGKSISMEISIKNELDILLKNMDEAVEANKGVMQISHAFIVPVFNVAWQMIVGHTTLDDVVLIKRLVLKSEEMLAKGILGAGLINTFPFVRFILPEFTGHNAQMAFYTDCHRTSRNLLRSSQKAMKNDGYPPAQNLIEAYVLKMEEEKNNIETVFTEENFMIIFMDLLQASSDTSSSLLESAMLYSILHPDVQAKLYEEIHRCIPEDRDVETDDKKRMIYTQAFLLETHRHANIVQNLIPRTNLTDVRYKDFVIKKGTVWLADLTTAYNDSKIWADPEAFLPERFIGGNGEIVNQSKIFPFGLGAALAEATYFLFFVTILRKYKLSTVPRQNPPRTDMCVGMTSKPFPFHAVFSLRT